MTSIRTATLALALAGVLSPTAFAQQQPALKAAQLTDTQMAQVVAAGSGSVYHYQTGAWVGLSDQGTIGAAFLKTVGKVTVCRNC